MPEKAWRFRGFLAHFWPGFYRKVELLGIELLGYDGVLKWDRTAESLNITMPKQQPGEYACAFRLK